MSNPKIRQPYDGRDRFRAVLEVLLWLCDEMERAGREESDAPRLYVSAGLQWVKDGDTRALTRARKMFEKWEKPIWPPKRSDPYDGDAFVRWRWIIAVKNAFDRRKDLVERSRVGARAYSFALADIAEVLVVMGEPPDASAHRICQMYSNAVRYDALDAYAYPWVFKRALEKWRYVREWKAGVMPGLMPW